MSYLATQLRENFKSMEDVTDRLFDLYVHTINYEFEHVEDIDWISVGYEQNFSVGIRCEGDESRRSLISILDYESVHYKFLENVETGLQDAPFFTALLPVIIARLEKRIKDDFGSRLNENFQMFIFTDDEWYHDPEVEVPDYNTYFESDEEKSEQVDFIKNFCTTDKLRDYLLQMINNGFNGKTLRQLSNQWI